MVTCQFIHMQYCTRGRRVYLLAYRSATSEFCLLRLLQILISPSVWLKRGLKLFFLFMFSFGHKGIMRFLGFDAFKLFYSFSFIIFVTKPPISRYKKASNPFLTQIYCISILIAAIHHPFYRSCGLRQIYLSRLADRLNFIEKHLAETLQCGSAHRNHHIDILRCGSANRNHQPDIPRCGSVHRDHQIDFIH